VSSTSDSPALTTAGFQVLLALASGQSHGYAVMGFVDQLTDGRVRLGPGTLYRTLARLVADELVRESGATDPSAPHDARRRYYELTPLGAQVVRDEAALLARLVDAAQTAGLPQWEPENTMTPSATARTWHAHLCPRRGRRGGFLQPSIRRRRTHSPPTT
jgi:DNA-binding PadR family transcriptional regulator